MTAECVFAIKRLIRREQKAQLEANTYAALQALHYDNKYTFRDKK